MESYNFQRVEKRWQRRWEKAGLFQAKDFSKKPRYYCLIEFPYPSGDGLHVGHTRSNTAMDIIARKRRMEGYNVLFPIGWDAFGLPTENYAIKTGIHPKIATQKNTDTFRRQLKSLGFSFDWSREINTTDPNYYKWTQWIFLQFFKHNLAYKKKIPINWCPSCKIGLANEEVVNGGCERCGAPTQKKEKEQWMLRITKYANRLLKDLDTVDYLEKIKVQQQNWIGRSRGVEIEFKIKNLDTKCPSVRVFTTRADTILGATYLVLSPEHEIISNLKSQVSNFGEVEKYIRETKKKSELQRMDLTKEKTGVELRGIKAINPATKKEIPVWVSDYVLSGYGTGAIMAVPTYDERDAEFAKKFNLPFSKALLISINEAIKKTGAKRAVQYHLRDWVFSRQHYWGEPIPMVYCFKCGWQPVPEKDLPVKLPDVKNYQPANTGESPLANIKNWVNTKCPKCHGSAKRETDTMPNWAGSSWYYLAYITRGNLKFKIKNLKLLKYWMPVDWYNGGMEHTTLHLLYSRFWNKFLYDIGVAPTSEPYKKRTSHGMILGEDGEKMSKSRGNVINPDEIVRNYGADAYRIYQMFMGPFDQAIPWNSQGIEGAKRFLNKVWNLKTKVKPLFDKGLTFVEKMLHQTIKKIEEDIENMKFNTAVSSLMILTNEFEKQEKLRIGHYELLITLLAPFAPHIANELAEKLKFKIDKWPKYDPKKIKEQTFELVVQINGKVRDRVEAPINISETEAKNLALKQGRVKNILGSKQIKKTIFIPNRLINIVV